MPFFANKLFHLTFSSRRSGGYKVPPRIGGHHFLLCQQTKTKDIAGQSANLNPDDHQDFVSSPDHGDREKTPGALTYSERIARKFMESDPVIVIIVIASIIVVLIAVIVIMIILRAT